MDDFDFIKAIGSTKLRRRGKRRRPINAIKKHTSKNKTQDGDFPMQNVNEIMMGASDYRDMYLSKFINTRIENDISSFTSEITVHGNKKSAIEYIEKMYSDCKLFSVSNRGVLIDVGDALVEISWESTSIRFEITSTFDIIREFRDQILEDFEEIKVFVDWVYNQHLQSVRVPIDAKLSPLQEMYPFIKEDLNSYYDRYIKSDASILLLIGVPGSGKTSFIRGLLTHTQSSAMVTYDQKILEQDALFSEFIEGNADVLVIEDADLFLSSRKDGNDMMHKFLNVSDGLVNVKGKKMIFSTNLPSINDVDQALLRPGRCFEVLHFGTLTQIEANALASKVGIELKEVRDDWTIAEIFGGIKTGQYKVKNKFGFC